MHHSTAFAASLYPSTPRRQKPPAAHHTHDDTHDAVRVVSPSEPSQRWEYAQEVRAVGKSLHTDRAHKEEEAEFSLGYYDILDDYDHPSEPRASTEEIQDLAMPKRRSLSVLVPSFILQSLNNSTEPSASSPSSPSRPTSPSAPARASLSRTHSRNPSAISMSTPSSPSASRLTTFVFGSARETTTTTTTATTTQANKSRARAYTTSATSSSTPYSTPTSPVSSSFFFGKDVPALAESDMIPPPVDYFNLPPPPRQQHPIDAILHSLGPSSQTEPSHLSRSSSQSNSTTSTSPTHSRSDSNSQSQPQPRKPSPPPAFLLDDDPFANLSTTPAIISSAASATANAASGPAIATPKRPPPLALNLGASAPGSSAGLPLQPTSPHAQGYISLKHPRSPLHPVSPSASVSVTASGVEDSSLPVYTAMTSNPTIPPPPASPTAYGATNQTQPSVITTRQSLSRPSSPPVAGPVPVPVPGSTHIASLSRPTSPNPPGTATTGGGATRPPTHMATVPVIVPRPQPVPASQRPAFRARPSLPSLDTLARMNVVIKPRKPRKGKPGAGLPFEPWNDVHVSNPAEGQPLSSSSLSSPDSSVPSSPSPSPSPTPTSSNYPHFQNLPSASGPLSPGTGPSTRSTSAYSSPPSSRPTSPPHSPFLLPIGSHSRPSSPPTYAYPHPHQPHHRYPVASRPLLPSEIMSLGSIGVGVEDIDVLDLNMGMGGLGRYPTISSPPPSTGVAVSTTGGPMRSPQIQQVGDYMLPSEAVVDYAPPLSSSSSSSSIGIGIGIGIGSGTPGMGVDEIAPSATLTTPAPVQESDALLPAREELSVVLEEGPRELEEAQADEARVRVQVQVEVQDVESSSAVITNSDRQAVEDAVPAWPHLRPPNVLDLVSPLQRLSRASSDGGVDPALVAEAEGLHGLLFRNPSQGSLERVPSPVQAPRPPSSSSSLLPVPPSRSPSRSSSRSSRSSNSLARSPSGARSPRLPPAPAPDIPLPPLPTLHLNPNPNPHTPSTSTSTSLEATKIETHQRDDEHPQPFLDVPAFSTSPPPLYVSSPSNNDVSFLGPYSPGDSYTTSPELQSYTPSLTRSSHPSSISLGSRSNSFSVSSRSRSSTSSRTSEGDMESSGMGGIEDRGLDLDELGLDLRRLRGPMTASTAVADADADGRELERHHNAKEDLSLQDSQDFGGLNAEMGLLLAKESSALNFSAGKHVLAQADDDDAGRTTTLGQSPESSALRPSTLVLDSDVEQPHTTRSDSNYDYASSVPDNDDQDEGTEFSYSERDTDQDRDEDHPSPMIPVRSVTGSSTCSSIPSSPPPTTTINDSKTPNPPSQSRASSTSSTPHPAKKEYFWFPSRSSVFSDMMYAPERETGVMHDGASLNANQLGLVLNGGDDANGTSSLTASLDQNGEPADAPEYDNGGTTRSHTKAYRAGYYANGNSAVGSSYSASPYVSTFSQRRSGGGDEDDDEDENRRRRGPRGLGGMGHAAEYTGGARSRVASAAVSQRSRAASSSGAASGASSDDDSTDDYGMPSTEPVDDTNGYQRHRHHPPQSVSSSTTSTPGIPSYPLHRTSTNEETSSDTIMPPAYDTQYPLTHSGSAPMRRVASNTATNGGAVPLPRYHNSHSTFSPPHSAPLPLYGNNTAASSRRPSASIPHSDVESSENDDDDDDDIPLAQRIPGALTAQKSIQRKVKEEREERRRAREAARARQLTLRPSGAASTSADPLGGAMSSSQEAAAAAAAARAIAATSTPPTQPRPRTQTLPGKTPPPLSAEDLSRKLQNVQLASSGLMSPSPVASVSATGMVSPDSFPQASPQAYAFASGGGAPRPRAKSISSRVANGQYGDVSSPSPPVPPLRSRSVRHPATSNSSPSAQPPLPLPTLRPMRSFHRPADAPLVPPPPPEQVERRVGRSSTSAARSHKDQQPRVHQRSLSLSRNHPSHHASGVMSGSSAPQDHSSTTPDVEPVPPLPSRPSHDDAHRKVLLKPLPDSAQRSTRPSMDVDRSPKPNVQQLLSPSVASATVGGGSSGSGGAKSVTSQQRVFVGDLQRFNIVNVGPTTTAQDVIDMIEAEGSLKGWVGSGGWMVFEVAKDFGMERPVRSFELLSDVQSSWLKDKTVNYFVLKITPLSIPLSRSAMPQSSPTHSGYVEWEVKRGKWSKRWLQLREHCIWLSKRDNRRDEVMLCSLSSFDAYHITRAHRAPKPFAFAIKSTDNLSLFENTADYLHSFACAEKDGRVWLEKILIARSYVLYHERHVLFQSKGATSSGANLSRSTTKKSPGSGHRPLQPLIAVPGTEVFEPGSLLAKKL